MSNNAALEIDQLQFGFSKEGPLFDQLNLSVPQGTTFGILGPNGAGKSTLIRIVLGLMPNFKGRVNIFGKLLDKERAAILQQTGFLLEGPRLYPHLSGIDNLKVFAAYRKLGRQRMEEILEEVGLRQQRDKRVRHYSTGMKQRLAIAIALLNDPQLLILDEPTNGLDPQGIVEIRQLIKALKAKSDRTILFCSHILSEVQQICDYIGVLHKGKFVFQGPKESFQLHSNFYRIETDNPLLAQQLLQEHFGEVVSLDEKEVVVKLDAPQRVNQVIDILRNANLSIFQIRRVEEDLESNYLRLIQ